MIPPTLPRLPVALLTALGGVFTAFALAVLLGLLGVRVPGWARFDFNAGYKWKSSGNRWNHVVGVALKNAFDTEYAYGTGPSQGNPRQWILRYSLLFK